MMRILVAIALLVTAPAFANKTIDLDSAHIDVNNASF